MLVFFNDYEGPSLSILHYVRFRGKNPIVTQWSSKITFNPLKGS